MTRTLTASLLAAGLACAGLASANDYGQYDYGQYDHAGDSGGYAWADVIHVAPIISRHDRPVTRQECYQQPVVYREPVRYRAARNDRTPALLGGIVGGVIGSQFGSGSGRDAATAAGALLGYSAVRDDQRRYGGYYVRGGREYVRHEDRCTTRMHYEQEESVTGYDVTYSYLGKTYRTTTDHHPGERIEVEVDVRPVR